MSSMWNCESRFVKITGAAGTGKTEALVLRVKTLIERGEDPANLLVLVATPSAVFEMRRRLRSAGVPYAQSLPITTPWDLSMEILSSPAARETTGRVPRVLSDYETRILHEDLKQLGGDQHRNKEIVKFLYREWSELGDKRSQFIISSEEANLHEGLKSRLIARGGVSKHELSNIAASYIADDNAALQQFQKRYVLVDDYQDLNRASQVLAGLLCSTQLVVAGNADQSCEVLDPYPYPRGLDEFSQEHASDDLAEFLVQDSRHPLELTAVCDWFCKKSQSLTGLPSRDGASGRSAVFAIRQLHDPSEETAFVARRVAAILAGAPGTEASDIAIVVPNALWGLRMEEALCETGIPCELALRTESRFKNQAGRNEEDVQLVFALINLASDPEDGVVWRTICGHGDSLYRSGEWTAFESWISNEGCGVRQGLGLLASCCEEPFANANKLVVRYREAMEILDGIKDEAGRRLALFFENKGFLSAALFEACFGPLDDDCDCARLHLRAHRSLFCPLFSGENRVRIGLPVAFPSLSAKHVLLTGAVDGFYPSARALSSTETIDHKKLYLAQDEREFYVALSRAEEDLLVTWFEHESVEAAEMSGMKVRRIRAERGGGRIATLSLSGFISGMDTGL
jgi:DNA helicase II / ATP-dependent DNA helicase PcrA